MIAELWQGLMQDTAWWDRAYLFDWAATIFLFFSAQAVKMMPVFERDFSVDDPPISFPHKHEQVSHIMNQYLSAIFPLGFSALLAIMNRSSHEFHHGLLAGWSGITMGHLVTDALKNRIGRLRPDFLARCAWDATLNKCNGKPNSIIGGRKSFPSGHATSAFSGLGFLFLLLASRTGAFQFSTPLLSGKAQSSRLLRLVLTLSPLFLAAWIAITRVEDHRHHKEDIIVGSIIGFSCAFINFSIYWHSPFSAEISALGLLGKPRLVYSSDATSSEGIDGPEQYELAAVDDEESVLFDTGPHRGGQRGNNTRVRGGRNGRGRR